MKPILLLLATAPLGGNAFQIPSAPRTVSCAKPKCSRSKLYLAENPNPNQNKEEPGALVAVKEAFGSFTNTNFDVDLDMLKANFMDGEVGARGEVWTGGALFLFLSILVGSLPIPYIGDAFTLLGGPGLIVAGGALVLASLNDLGSKNLTPFLSPVSDGSLITDGIYSKIRHPIYSGLICLCAGFSIWTESAPRLVLTAFLILLLNVKSDKEEEYLTDKFPEYAAYRATTGKFYPGDWSFGDN